jgi:hypothetical protein
MTVRERYWPAILDEETARKVARQAFWVAVAVAGLTVLFATLAAFGIPMIAGVDAWAFLDAALFSVIAFGIWKMSRLAALAGLVLFVLERYWGFQGDVGFGYLLVTIVFTLAFVNGVRATFKYHQVKTVAHPQPVDAAPLSPR